MLIPEKPCEPVTLVQKGCDAVPLFTSIFLKVVLKISNPFAGKFINLLSPKFNRGNNIPLSKELIVIIEEASGLEVPMPVWEITFSNINKKTVIINNEYFFIF